MVSEKRMKNSVMKIIGSIFFNYEGGLFESFHLTKYKPLHNMYIYAIHFDNKGEIPFFQNISYLYRMIDGHTVTRF